MKPLHEYTTEELKNMLNQQNEKTYLRRMIYKELLHRTFYPNSRNKNQGSDE
jgi:hypothetical protein